MPIAHFQHLFLVRKQPQKKGNHSLNINCVLGRETYICVIYCFNTLVILSVPSLSSLRPSPPPLSPHLLWAVYKSLPSRSPECQSSWCQSERRFSFHLSSLCARVGSAREREKEEEEEVGGGGKTYITNTHTHTHSLHYSRSTAPARKSVCGAFLLLSFWFYDFRFRSPFSWRMYFMSVGELL